MLPKYCRIIVFADSAGRFSACAAYEKHGIQDRISKGFMPILRFRIPLRRLRSGWFPYYRNLIGRIVLEGGAA